MSLSITSKTTSVLQSLTTSSATARHKALFDALDTNSDGKIDSLELSAAAKAANTANTEAKTTTATDSTAAEAVSSTEDSSGITAEDLASLMKLVDTNSDGSISEAENDTYLTSVESQQASEAQGSRPPGPPPGPPPGGGAGGATDTSSTTVFDKLDTNKDGKVSMEELLAGQAKAEAAKAATSDTSATTTEASSSESKVKELFKKIDTNGDGSLDSTEFDAFKAKMDEAFKRQAETAAKYLQTSQASTITVGSTINGLA